MSHSVSGNDCRHVSEHQAERRSSDHNCERLVLSRQGYGRDLGLVAHLDEKESHERRQEHAMARSLRFTAFELVRYEGPHGHCDKGEAEPPSPHLGLKQSGEPRAYRAG